MTRLFDDPGLRYLAVRTRIYILLMFQMAPFCPPPVNDN